MSVALDSFAGGPSAPPTTAAVLRSTAFDRLFVAGGAWLVPIPILAFYLLRSLGCTTATAEDLVTLLVMVPIGGPHVFATYTRTFLNPRFAREDRLLFALALVVIATVAGAAVASAFFDVVLAGSPPLRYVLTFFFFWAGVHIVQQNSYVAACLAEKAPPRAPPRWWGGVDYAVMLLAMYPASLFRMSMVDTADATMRSADPGALATQAMLGLGFAPQFVDDYVFRIGRVAPILPDWLRSPSVWIGVTVAFAASLVLFAIKTRRELATGTLIKSRFQLVLCMAVLGAAVPLFPNLDSAFQGLNAWHSFQYLGILWLMNKKSQARGEIKNRAFDLIMAPDHGRRFYGAALLATVTMLAIVFLAALAIQLGSGGEFVLFGHGAPRYGDDGRELYRPGAVLLAYYMTVFGFLLTHYLHDGAFFFRKRYLLDR
jgi:hypothetical protein